MCGISRQYAWPDSIFQNIHKFWWFTILHTKKQLSTLLSHLESSIFSLAATAARPICAKNTELPCIKRQWPCFIYLHILLQMPGNNVHLLLRKISLNGSERVISKFWYLHFFYCLYVVWTHSWIHQKIWNKMTFIMLSSVTYDCSNASPGSYWSSSHWKSAFNFEKRDKIVGQSSIFGDHHLSVTNPITK